MTYEKFVTNINGYLNKLRNLKNHQLDEEFINNIQNFTAFVEKKHRLYTQGTRITESKKYTMSEYSNRSNMFLNGLLNLYPCLYKMNETTRYPLIAFGYDNHQYLNQKKVCNILLAMINHLINTYKFIIQNPEALYWYLSLCYDMTNMVHLL